MSIDIVTRGRLRRVIIRDVVIEMQSPLEGIIEDVTDIEGETDGD